jgi:hypothetical protein
MASVAFKCGAQRQRDDHHTHRPWVVQGVLSLRIHQADVEAALLILLAASSLVLAGVLVGRRVMTPAATPVRQIRIQRGDTLWSLASKYGDRDQYTLDRLDHLARLNGMRAGETLRPGDVLVVPGDPDPASRVAAR